MFKDNSQKRLLEVIHKLDARDKPRLNESQALQIIDPKVLDIIKKSIASYEIVPDGPNATSMVITFNDGSTARITQNLTMGKRVFFDKDTHNNSSYFGMLYDNGVFYHELWDLVKGTGKEKTGEPEINENFEEVEEGDDKWIQKAIDPKHKGYCTPMTKDTCTPARKAFAKRAKAGELDETGETDKYGNSLEDDSAPDDYIFEKLGKLTNIIQNIDFEYAKNRRVAEKEVAVYLYDLVHDEGKISNEEASQYFAESMDDLLDAEKIKMWQREYFK